MKKKELHALKEKNEKSILGTLEKKRSELLDTYLKTKTGKEKNVKKVKNIRKDIAQILTVLKEKEIMRNEEPKAEVKEEKKETKKTKVTKK